MLKNKFGLSRYIPDKVKRQIRVQSKFGCVICRNAICHYEHIVPEFHEAKEHNPNKMCLLCGSCHDKVTRGRISKETVKRQYEYVQNNSNIRPPFDEFDLASDNPIIVLGAGTFEKCENIIQFGDEILLKIEKAEIGSHFPRISGIFYDNKGNKLLIIKENIWESTMEGWDLIIKGNELKILSFENKIVLKIIIDPPNKISILELNMYINGSHLICNERDIIVGKQKNGIYNYLGFGSFSCKGADTGVYISDSDTKFDYHGIKILGGEGVILKGAGITLGKKAKIMHFKDLRLWFNNY